MAIEELVDTLLYEGYALYPYTPGATKNATPTPFGIVYPPAYAAGCDAAHDHARLECVVQGGSALEATIRWITAPGDEHRLRLGPIAVGERVTVERPGARFTLRADRGDGVVRCCVHNTAEVAAGLERGDALRHSLISVHIVLQVRDGRFVSPLQSGRESVNTWPVLASDSDDTILGAAIVLPDHPQVAPRSHGNLFDNTEIEEALVLHVHSLTDAEREAITDPKVSAMLERTLSLGPQDIIGLHGGLEEVSSAPEIAGCASGSGVGDAENNPGEDSVTVDGVTFVKGSRLLLTPGTDRSVHDRMLNGRRATLERIYIDYDERVHLAVTVDDDPGQQLMRETGRYLFFFAHEVQPL
ncbi:MAG TPA: hypothetical protein VKV21_10335 [Solirubrobacteraceae bacterium]|nr:hypothetical protein [Solirubrobacteraceae bacterium]